MNLETLISTARDLSGDGPAGQNWSDAEWTAYANDAEREACRRGRLLVDSTTAAVCQIALTTTDASYDLHPSILFIRRAKLTGRSLVLSRRSYKDLDREAPDWESETGEPSSYVPDFGTAKFRPYPSPAAGGTVTLTVVRLPLADMANDANQPEIHARYHDSLLNWMLYRAYLKNDAETLNKIKAAEYLTLFEAEFGKKSSALDEAWLERNADFLEEEGNF